MSQFYRCDSCGTERDAKEFESQAGWINLYRSGNQAVMGSVVEEDDHQHIYGKDFCSVRCVMTFLMQVQVLDDA